MWRSCNTITLDRLGFFLDVDVYIYTVGKQMDGTSNSLVYALQD